MDTPEQVAAHNLRSMWSEVHDRLAAAKYELELAQAMIDADIRKPHIADNMDETIDAVERFRVLAQEYA